MSDKIENRYAVPSEETTEATRVPGIYVNRFYVTPRSGVNVKLTFAEQLETDGAIEMRGAFVMSVSDLIVLRDLLVGMTQEVQVMGTAPPAANG